MTQNRCAECGRRVGGDELFCPTCAAKAEGNLGIRRGDAPQDDIHYTPRVDHNGGTDGGVIYLWPGFPAQSQARDSVSRTSRPQRDNPQNRYSRSAQGATTPPKRG